MTIHITDADAPATRETLPSGRILVPLDGTPESNAALPLARTLAVATRAPVTLLRVIPHADPETMRYARGYLQKIAEEIAASVPSVDCAVRGGQAAEEIVREIRTEPPAMVVMRTHARSGVERAVLGSVTEQVLKVCQVPVVLMRPGVRRITHLRTLLVPVDGSPGGAVALGTAVGLARSTGAAVKLIEVAVPVAMQTLIAYEYGGMGYYDPAWDEETLASARAYIDALVLRLRESGVSASGDAVMAPVVDQAIVEAADSDDGVDLVVMSTQALTGPARALLGSVADAVVRAAHCPVLLVHRSPPQGVGA